MKASTKAASVSTSSKAVASTKATTDTKEVQTVSVPSQVRSAIETSATASAAAQVAVTTQEQTIVKLGELVGNTMGKNARDITRASLKPIFAEAYGKANKSLSRPKDDTSLALYVGQQMSRVLSIAYPGGLKATPAQANAARKQIELGKAAGLGTLALLDLAGGKAKVHTDPATNKATVVKVANSAATTNGPGSGGGNAKTPLETLTKSIGDALTLAKTADIDREQMLVIISDALITLEMMDATTEVLQIAEQD